MPFEHGLWFILPIWFYIQEYGWCNLSTRFLMICVVYQTREWFMNKSITQLYEWSRIDEYADRSLKIAFFILLRRWNINLHMKYETLNRKINMATQFQNLFIQSNRHVCRKCIFLFSWLPNYFFSSVSAVFIQNPWQLHYIRYRKKF